MSANEDKYVLIYTDRTEKSIEEEFRRKKDKCYLDHAGATLYSEKQIHNVFEELQQNLFGNPHSRSTTSKLTSDSIDQIRFQILEFFHTTGDEYTVVFTSGATAALKLVAEGFDYNGGDFVYLQDNHTSVLGMREHAFESKSIDFKTAFDVFNQFECLNNQKGGLRGDSKNEMKFSKVNNLTNKINVDNLKKSNISHSYLNEKNASTSLEYTNKNSLFVYPAQCNFSGFKYPLNWVQKVQNGALSSYLRKGNSNWFCLLDAASYCSTNDFDLRKIKPDFVCVSFYKIFGYPTGSGALLVKNSAAGLLRKRYFGGGTVFMAMSSNLNVVRRENLAERLEDGTLPFLSILSLRHGFETLQRLNLSMDLISKHTYALAKHVFLELKDLTHGNGQKSCILYHDGGFTDRNLQGGIVNFNLLRCDGSYIGFSEVMHIANLFGVQLRTGCFCNPGACQRHLGLTDDDIKYHFEKGHVCGDQYDLIDGKPTGSVRISFGYMSTKTEADYFLNLITTCFVTKSIPSNPNSNRPVAKQNCRTEFVGKVIGRLEKVQLYPIKSCGPFVVNSSWDLVPTGLKYDREWMIINSLKVCMTQKNEPRMCLIKPVVDVESEKLILTCEGFPDFSVPLKMENIPDNTKHFTKVCTDSVTGLDCGDEVSDWLSDVLGHIGLRLIKQSNDECSRISKKGEKQTLSLANKAQFLLLNTQSVEWLKNSIPEEDLTDTMDGLIDRFRPNLVVNLMDKFIENDFNLFKIGEMKFAFQGKCTRCQMICIDQQTGEKSVEPLRTISKQFQGKINFGVYLRQMDDGINDRIEVNSIVTAI